MLREIQDAAIESSSELAPLLRRCQVLASRLDHAELAQWVRHELNGYPTGEPLPSYRVMSLRLTGTFFGPLGSALRGVTIAPAALPKKLVELLKNHPLPSPIAEYEALANSGRDLQIQMSGDVILAIGHNVYQKDFACVEAVQVMPAARLKGLVDSVRNRVLSFALELGKLEPAALDKGASAPQSLSREVVSQVFHTQIIGDNLTVAVGDHASAQAVHGIVPGDLESLASFLRSQTVEESDLALLRAAVAADPKPTTKTAMGTSVSSWIGKMAEKAASGAWKVSLDVATKVLASAVSKYYGLG